MRENADNAAQVAADLGVLLDASAILRYIELQKNLFIKMVPLASDFKEGIVEGLNLVKAYIEINAKVKKACPHCGVTEIPHKANCYSMIYHYPKEQEDIDDGKRQGV